MQSTAFGKMPVTQGLRIMKMSALLLLLAFQTLARPTSAQVTLKESAAPLEKVLKAIKKQSGYDLFFNETLIKEKGKSVIVNVDNVSVDQALAQVFKNQDQLTYTITGRIISIREKEKKLTPATSQSANTGLEILLPPVTIDVQAKVVNEKGEPLAGVSVLVKGTRLGTSTDENGMFELKGLDKTAVLQFTGVNIETYETKLSAINGTPLVMKAKVSKLEDIAVEVVNTGYQSLPRERSSGSFGKPNMEIALNRSTSMNILQRLDGLVAGLTVNNAPGSDNVLIRGLNSVNASRNPLYVVDGIPMNDLSSINPQDIADISVLKDATAASIWGAKASNGVIVIATKKGRPNEKIKVNYDGFISFQGKPDLNYIPPVSSAEYIQAAKETFDPVVYPWNTVTAYDRNGVNAGLPPHEVILYNQYRGIISQAQATKSLDSLSSLNNGEQIENLWYRNASLMNHTISLSGGGKVHSFYGSLAFTNTQSNRPGEEIKSYKINLRQDFNLNKWLQAYLITDFTSATTYTPRNININNRFLPYQLFKDGNGNNISMPYMAYLSDSIRMAFENRSRVNLDYNPLNEVNLGYTKSNAFQNRIIGGLTVKLMPGLRFEGVYGYINGTNKTNSFDDEKSYLVRRELVQFTVAATPAATPAYYLPTTGGRYTVSNLVQTNWTVRNQLVYDYAWQNRKHQLVALAGQEAQEQLATTNQSTLRGYNEMLQTYGAVDYNTLNSTGVASTVMPTSSNGSSILATDFFNQTESQIRYTSYYANAAYTFNRKYSINGSWRIDQSNLFGLDKSAQNKPVWSAGARWSLGDENFMKGVSWLNRLALRGTYGVTGNSPLPGTASSYDILSALTSGFFPNGLQITTPGNTKLTWESTKTINIGFDFSVLSNRLNGSIDVYSKKTDNLIGNLAVNGFTGYSSITGNFGDMQNMGIEFNLSSTNIQSKSFVWQTILTGAFNKNTITHLNTASPITTGQLKTMQRYMAGYPAYAIFAYQYAGLDTLGDPMIYLNNKTVTKARNVASPNDIAFMGTYQPVWNGGLSNIFTYQNFSLGINIVYNLGHVMRRDVNLFYTGRLALRPLVFTGGPMNAEFDDRWKTRGDEASTLIPSYISSSSVSSTRRETEYYVKGDVNVESASFIKLRDITLSYSLPKSLLNRIKADNISFRVQVSNLMLWKANKYGIDPEFQDPFAGTRSMPSNQEAITVGAHVTF